MVKQLPRAAAHGALAIYRRNQRRVYVLTYSTLQTRVTQYFGLECDLTLFRSIVAHEIAHAVANQNFSMDAPEWIAQEYIAYVTQLATLPDGVRAAILENYQNPGYESAGAMKPVHLLLGPEIFAVKAFRHFIQLEQPTEFLHQLLAGEVYLEPAIDQ